MYWYIEESFTLLQAWERLGIRVNSIIFINLFECYKLLIDRSTHQSITLTFTTNGSVNQTINHHYDYYNQQMSQSSWINPFNHQLISQSIYQLITVFQPTYQSINLDELYKQQTNQSVNPFFLFWFSVCWIGEAWATGSISQVNPYESHHLGINHSIRSLIFSM